MKAHHDNECEEYMIECNHCKEYVKKKVMNLHIEINCPDYIVSCSFQGYGCIVSRKRKDMDEHLKCEVNYHLNIVKEKCDALETKYYDMENKFQNQLNEVCKQIQILKDQNKQRLF